MTVYVETDFLLALAKDSDWLQQSAEDALEAYDVETSAFSNLELLLAREWYEFDYVPLVANLLELVPVRDDEERQIVLKAVNYYDEGMTWPPPRPEGRGIRPSDFRQVWRSRFQPALKGNQQHTGGTLVSSPV